MSRIADSARALRAAGFEVRVEIDETSVTPAMRHWLDIYAEVLGLPPAGSLSVPASTGSGDYGRDPATRTVGDVRVRSADLVREVFAATGTDTASSTENPNPASTTEFDAEETYHDADADL